MINNCNFIGRVGQVNKMDSYTQFSLALNEKDKNNNQVTTWVNLVAFGKLKTDIVDKFLNKGDVAYASGKYNVAKKGDKEYHSFIANVVRVVSSANKNQTDTPNVEKEVDSMFPF